MNLSPQRKTRTEIGSYGPGKLQLNLAPDRIDFIWNAEVGAAIVDASLGEPNEVLSTLIGKIDQWLQAFDCVFTRVAIGGTYLLTADSRESSYGLLQEKFPSVALDHDVADDVLLQINRPVDIDSAQLGTSRFNRICKWNVVQMKFAQVSFGPDGITDIQQESGPYALSCEQDFNCAIADSITPAQAREILSGLFQGSMLFLEKGDEARNE